MSSEYKGRRVSGSETKPGSETPGYKAKRRETSGGSGGLFYDPHKDWEAESDVDLEQNKGGTFKVSKGRHEAILEGVYSSEIDGGEFDTLIEKKSRKRLPIIAVGIAALLVVVLVGYFFTRGGETTPPPKPADHSLDGKLQAKYPDIAFAKGSTTFAYSPKGFTSSSGSSLTSNYPATPNGDKCALITENSLCLVGSFRLPGMEEARVFATNALPISGTFQELLDYAPLEESKTIYRGEAVVSFTGAPTRFLLFMDGANGDGWFVEVPLQSSKPELQKLSDSFTYKP